MPTYEIVRPASAGKRVDQVEDLPPMEPGTVLLHDGRFWRVDRIEEGDTVVAGRLIVSPSHDESKG